MEIPYGRSNFEEIRRKGFFYVDKTPFLPILERGEIGYPIFLRPRRLGKSTFVSLLTSYYDLSRRDRFDELFKGLWIHEHPTPERNSYLVLFLDFSTVSTDAGQEVLRQTFFSAVRRGILGLSLEYRKLVPELGRLVERADHYAAAGDLLGDACGIVQKAGHTLYVVIDEYDHFANRLLSMEGEGIALYEQAIVRRTGFVRTFYTALKSGTLAGAIGRMFITGVTPLMLDDLSSGFNIVTNVSQRLDLNTLAGFTRADVERAVSEFLAAHPDLAKLPELDDRAALMDLLTRYYDGYRFSPKAPERVFNSTMVLYFLAQLTHTGGYPYNMLDVNVRTEYAHLQRVGVLTGTEAAERRLLLETILGGEPVHSDLVERFSTKSLSERAPYVSLLYHLGMLTLKDTPRDGIGYHFEIPNRVIRELQWEHLAHTLVDQGQLAINVDDIQAGLEAMAVRGEIAPFVELFHRKVIKAIGLKDTRRLDEKTIKLLFMMYVSLGRVFHVLSEKEMAQGYCDLFLAAAENLASVRYSWLLELKYLKAGAKPAQIEATFAEAEKQVERYASDKDLLPVLVRDRELRAGTLVFVGTQKALFRPWPPEPGVKAPRKKASPTTKARRAAPRPKTVATRARR